MQLESDDTSGANARELEHQPSPIDDVQNPHGDAQHHLTLYGPSSAA
jgi:hypothetical protein